MIYLHQPITSFPRATELIGIGKELAKHSFRVVLQGMEILGLMEFSFWIAPTTIVSGTSYHNVLFTPKKQMLMKQLL